jgi:NADH-quinone oxidoreductase subunit N
VNAPSLSNTASILYAAPEIALGLAPLLIVAWDLWGPTGTDASESGESGELPESRAAGKAGRVRQVGAVVIALSALLVSALGSAAGLLGAARLPQPVPVLLFDGQLACDGYACAFRLFFAIVTAFVVIAAIPTREAQFGPHGRGAAGGEFFALLLVVCLGMNLMAMGRTLLVVYMAIEIVSVVSFVLAGFRLGGVAGRRSSEAALKYVVYGGVSSGVMLYGMSWLYGLSQSIALSDISERVATLTREQGHLPNAVAIGAACVMAGFAYKIAAAPFHMWAPDVYEGAPTLVAAFLSVGPKAAGFAVLIRFFREGFGSQAGLSEAQSPWPVLVGVIAAATMTIGNLSALGQTNLKRLLACSSIAHAGTMLLAFSVPGSEGIAAIAFYLLVYCAMNLGAFMVVLAVSEAAGAETIDGVRGLGVRAPGMAAALAVFLFSLVGLPPFAGFVGKLYVFVALLRGGGDYRSWYFFLAVLGVVNTVVSLFYYARVLRALYLAPPPPGEGGPVSVRRLHAVMTALLVAPTVFLGVWWGPLYDFVTRTVTMIP